jgi:arylsulfatase A-like enzyme
VRENGTLRLPFVLGFTSLLLLSAGCRKAPGPPSPAATAFKPYRFDDEFQSSATVTASSVHSSALVADPIVWHNFFSENDITWNLLRGRMGFRKGDLVVKGEGNTPVILSPNKQPIAWGLYEAVEIRMLAEGGQEIKIKIGDREFKQKLGPRGQYNTYRFDIHAHRPADGQPLLLMPTDGLDDLVAIRSIELIPKKVDFPQAAGRQTIGKREEYRNALYAHSPSSLAYEVNVPKDGRLRFGIGTTEKNSPIVFRVLADSKELYSKTLADAGVWEDADVDLASYAGRNVKLVFQTNATHEGAVGLWANPLLTTNAPGNRPNVIVYMIDTLRADHTSLYGYARDTTPFLKKLGAQGMVFDDCQVQATWTKPSVASLLTSLYSFTHGIVHDDDTIPAGATTLAGQLRAAGYVTASVLANPLAGRITGLQRGFDYVSEWQAVERYLSETEDRATDSAAVNKVVFPWLERHRDEPFFLYAHSTDPHAPYRPPAGFEEKFANPAESPEFNRDFKKLKELALSHGGFGISRALCAQGGVDPNRFIQRAVDRYDGKILHNDWSLQQLVGKLKQLGILDNTLIVVVSDHGEEFWEHGWTGHGQSLYQELAHGVLLMWNPKLIPRPGRVGEPVQSIDVMPTVLDLLGLKIPDAVEGQSLAPFAKGQPFQRRGPVMTSRFAHPYEQRNELDPENHIDSIALLDATWKLIYREKGKEVGLNRVELYDRRADRVDAKDVAAQHPRETSQMMTEIGKWIDQQKQIRRALGQGTKATLDRQTLDQLRSLGYLGGKQ